MMRMLMMTMMMDVFRHISDRVGGGGGDDDDIVLCRHPEQYLQKSSFTWYLQYFRDVGPSYIVTKTYFWTLRARP